MLCPHCGANEPEIRIGNKLFCSRCGLPIQKKASEEVSERPQITHEKKNDLSNTFSRMANTLTEKDEEVSYASSDSDSDEDIVTATNIKSETVADLNSKGAQKKTEGPSIEKTVEKTSPEKTREPRKASPSIISTLDKVNDEKDSSSPQIAKSKPQIGVKNETEKSPEERKAAKEVPEEIDDGEKHKDFNKSVEKIDKLGAASRLVDILEESYKEKDIDKKKQKIKDRYKSAEKLLDILEKPEQTEKLNNQKIKKPKNQGKKPLELNSHLDTDEIALTKEDFEKTKNQKKPIAKDDNKPDIPEDVKEEIREELKGLREDSDTSKRNIEVANLNKGDLPPESQKEAVDIVTEWPNEDIDFDSIQKINTEDDSTEETKTKADKSHITATSKKQKKDKGGGSKDIHALGDKRGHIDHWPEEEVINIDKSHLNETDNEHPLTSYLKELVDEKRDKKKKKVHPEKAKRTENKKDKSKKKAKPKKERKKGRTLKIILGTMFFLIINLSSYFLYQNFATQNTEQVKKKALLKPTFDVKEASFIPVGFEETLPIESTSDSFTTTFTFITDQSKQIIIRQSYTDQDSEDLLDNYILKQTSEYTSELVGGFTLYYFNNEMTFIKDDIWYIIKATYKIDQSELKKIQESFL